ncbi:hypothetical protein GCM10011578_055480 [Streptomyces fuscichromogenes]|uniref:Rhodanese domain-containing protein n=1 Tax=Streptomyces fuscichromogenes TaxID=1324013 RepID=A0A918CTK8_9ACTN|nr:hypothetical protein GCM10011578_055480 [Streptomyces fuscichromogenes]
MLSADGVPNIVRPDREGFGAGHAPGARFADLTELCDPADRFAFTLPSSGALAAAAGALGIGTDTHVVAYDTTTTAWATRLWWLLRVFGHDRVSVLDGGLHAWRESGHPVETARDPSTCCALRPCG